MTAAVLATPRVVIPPPAAGSPDADLIRLATEFVELSREFNRLSNDAGEVRHPAAEIEQRIAAIVSRLHEMAPTIAAIPALSEDGLRAKAAFVLHHASDDADQDKPELVSDDLAPAHSLAVDLLRPRAVLALAGALSHPDAALLTLHNYFIASQLRVQELSRTHLRDDDAFEANNEPLYAGQRLMVEKAGRLRATTLEGIRARARMWLAEGPDNVPAEPEPGINLHDHLLLQLLRDLFSQEEIAAFASPNSDFPAYERAAKAAMQRQEPLPAVSPLTPIADRLEELERQLDRIDVAEHATDGDMMPPLRAWWTTAEAVPSHPIVTAGDVTALARICRCVWKRSQGDDCDLREQLDQKLHEAVIARDGGRPEPAPDAALIAACAAYDDLERRSLATFDGAAKTPADEDSADRLRDQLHEQQEPHFDLIMATPARTLAGLRAKARTLTIENLEIMKAGPGDRSDCLLHSLLRDLLAGDDDAPIASTADAGIIATCTEGMAAWADFDRLDRLDADGDRAETMSAYTRGCAALREVMNGPLPVTAAGMVAVARLTLASTSSSNLGEPLDVEVNHVGEGMAWRLVQLMAGIPPERVQMVAADHAALRTDPVEVPEAVEPTAPTPAVPADPDPTFALIAAEAERFARLATAVPGGPDHDKRSGPYYSAYHGFAEAALLFAPASLAETMTLAAFIQEEAGALEGLAGWTEDDINAIGGKMCRALGNVVQGIHRFGGVPMSAADPALDYLTGTAGAAA